MATCTNIKLDVQTGTDRTIYATWAWKKSHTDHYEVRWYYTTGDGVLFVGTDSTTKSKQNTYSAPENAKRVGFRVKPVSTKTKKNGKDVYRWIASWSTIKYFDLKNVPPSTPPTPTVTMNGLKLTASLDNLNVNAKYIQFQIVKYYTKSGKLYSSIFSTINSTIAKGSSACTKTVTTGGDYKVRARAIRGKEYSSWSEYSGSSGTPPSASKGWEFIKAITKTSVEVNWYPVSNAKTYEIEYTLDKRYFDSSSGMVQSISVDATLQWSHAEITGLETGKEWFFRMRAVNDNGSSPWTPIESIIMGSDPIAPTTWSSTTTAIVGESVMLYWVHNSEDGSSQKYAEIELTIDGVVEPPFIVENTADEDEKDKTSSYELKTSSYAEGTKILWRVRTSGITNTFGDWSIQRTIDVYAMPTLELNVTDIDGNNIETLTSFPFYISGVAGPDTQKAIGYHLSIIANESYDDAVDQIGNPIIVSKGESIYSKFFDTSENLLVEMSAYNIDLENNKSYKISCTASMDSGLTATSTIDEFVVAWEETIYEPDMEFGYDPDTVSFSIQPYCKDESENLVEDVMLSVYRREFDGSFTEIETNIDNTGNITITDPHPALDYAKYRIVAISKSTGAIKYYDPPGEPIGEKSVIIQWNEQWTTFDTSNEDPLAEPILSFDMVKLPYNIDISESYDSDVELVKYVGRKHPVSYYGTQLGVASSWNVEIDKKDEETIYALRRLAIWMGDVYVREPSGTGYWANISVSFSQTHCEVTIPVTLEITRVEGGM